MKMYSPLNNLAGLVALALICGGSPKTLAQGTSPHKIVSPTPGSTLHENLEDCAGLQPTTFIWEADPESLAPRGWWLTVSDRAPNEATGAPGPSNIYNSGMLGAPTRSIEAPIVNTLGNEVYVTLWSLSAQAQSSWRAHTTSYTLALVCGSPDMTPMQEEPMTPAQEESNHQIVSPLPGSALYASDSTCLESQPITFTWEADPARDIPHSWWITLSTIAPDDTGAPGNADIHSSGVLAASTRTIEVPSINTVGNEIYFTLWSLIQKGNVGRWAYQTVAYQIPQAPSLIFSSNPATPTSGSLTFNANDAPIRFWWIYAGVSKQGFDLMSDGFETDPATQSAITVPYSNFPSDGSEVHITLFWRLEGEGPDKWKCREYIVPNFENDPDEPTAPTKPTADTPILTSPAKRSALTTQLHEGCYRTPTIRFDWHYPTNASQAWRVRVNHRGTRIRQSGDLPRTSDFHSFDYLPLDGTPLELELWWLTAEHGWRFISETYETAKQPTIIDPVEGSILTRTTTELTLDPNGTPVRYWWIYAGDSPQDLSYMSDGFEEPTPDNPTTRTFTLTNLPQDGSKVYVTIFWRLEGETDRDWKCREVVYQLPNTITTSSNSQTAPLLTPIEDDALATYTVQVHYHHNAGIDRTTLGDDDVELNNTPIRGIFDGPPKEPLTARLANVRSTSEGNLSFIATYEFDRPEDGWESLGDFLTLTAIPGSVTDASRRSLTSGIIGRVPIQITQTDSIEASLNGFPQAQGASPETIEIEVNYKSSPPINSAIFDGSELRVTLPITTKNPTPTQANVSLLAGPVRMSNGLTNARYRISAPADGWKDAQRVSVAYAPGQLGHEGHPEWLGLGSIALRPQPDLTATLVSSVANNAKANHAFQIVLERRSGALSQDLLYNTTVRLGHPWSPINVGKAGLWEAEWVKQDLLDNGRRARIYLTVERPSEGWAQLGQQAIPIRFTDTKRLTSKSASLSDIGAIPVQFSPVAAPHQKAFEDWISEMESSLGLPAGELEDPETDLDGDGLSNLSEFGLGSDPQSAQDHGTIQSEVRADDEGITRLFLEFPRRRFIGGLQWLIEGSVDGEHWQTLDDQFEFTGHEIFSNEVEKVTVRSLLPLDQLETKLFRVAMRLNRQTD